MLNVLLIASLVFAIGSVGYVFLFPMQSEPFSELYLLTENESGHLVAEDYPRQIEQGESRELVVGIRNRERARTEYTVVVQMQEVRTVRNHTVVQNATKVRRFQTTLAPRERWHRPHTISPTTEGQLQLQYLLYKGAPRQPLNRSTAYREVHLQMNVTER
ncbi:DUF1616 domain-containing protein [Halomicroarcula limicola]|uniref:DUF1616 domain-containing protein n=1 Tax=Haloarcula limicola TaxID=1429915 RepID=A0A8J7YDH0_9EURY|nr:DUF1616 domain-containing protein [Halomicroarcula limicola]